MTLSPSGVHAQLQLPIQVLDNAVVVGRVLGVREWTPPGKVRTPMQFITLGDSAGSERMVLEVHLKAAHAVEPNAVIEATGPIKLVSDFQGGVKLRLTGTIRILKATVPESLALVKTPDRGIRTLQALLRSLNRPNDYVLAIASDNGKADFLHAFSRHSKNSNGVRFVAMRDEETVLGFLADAQRDDACKGIFLIRGGGNQLQALWHWNEAIHAAVAQSKKPIFSALGHASDELRIERMCDGVYAVPALLGAAWGELSGLTRIGSTKLSIRVLQWIAIVGLAVLLWRLFRGV